MPGISVGLGKGLSEPCSPNRTAPVFGTPARSFNPYWWNCDPVITGATSSFDLSPLTKDSSFAVALCNVPTSLSGLYQIDFKWYRSSDDTLLRWGQVVVFGGPGRIVYAADDLAYSDIEVVSDGGYYVTIEVSGPESLFTRIDFTVSGIPDAGIFDSIINWIKTAISSITSAVTDWVTLARDFVVSAVNGLINDVNTLISGWIDNVIAWVRNAVDWITATYNAVTDWVSNAYATIEAAVTSAVTPIFSWVTQARDVMIAWVSTEIGNLENEMAISLGAIPALITSIGTNIGSYFTWLTVWLPQTIGDLLSSWWDTFMGKVLDFQNWVGRLGDAVWTYLMHDVPGSSPFLGGVIAAVLGLMTSYLIVKYPEQIAAIGTSLIDTTIRATAPVSNLLMGMFNSFITQLSASVSGMGIASPERALSMSDSLVKVGATVITGLIGMTFAGELTVLGSKLGLGNISAMIYDLTNYKVLTGAFVGALAFAAIQTPLRYYYQNTFRPKLPGEGEASAMFARDRLASGEYRQLLGYYGLADRWHDNYEDLAYRPMSLVALSSLCSSGGFDEEIVLEVLKDRGINPKWRPYMLDLYRRKGQDTIKGTMSSVPISRYKQGFTTQMMFRAEMSLLSYTGTEIDKYQAAADLSYATDYITDLISAWQAQVRKKMMSLDAYRAYLTEVIMVPERIDALVIKEITNAPVEEPKAVGMSIAVTRFKEGMTAEEQFRQELLLLGCPPVDLNRNVAAAQLSYTYDYTLDLVTAYRDAIRANNLSLDEYREALLSIPLVPERVEGYCLIERARIKPKQKLTSTSPATAYYATDIGKIQVDTIRRRRRKGTATRDEEIAGLIGTGYEPNEATVIADNDNERLAKGTTGAEESLTAS